MRKIDKTAIFATKYQTWLVEQLQLPVEQRKSYDANAAQFKFYIDIVINLFYCQNGLCAYTEEQLCPKDYYQHTNWICKTIKDKTNQHHSFDESVFNVPKVFNGELDHFDESLKTEKGWDWDNFFMIDADTNNRKGSKPIDYRLKPDAENYDPFIIFDYSMDTHRFIVNTDFPVNDEKDREKLQDIIDNVLGINFPNLVNKRAKAIAKHIVFGIPFDTETENEFPTAFEFCQRISKIS